MSTLTNVFTNIADSIRNTFGVSDIMKPINMANDINNFMNNVPPYIGDTNFSYEGYFPYGSSNDFNGLAAISIVDPSSGPGSTNITNLYRYFANNANNITTLYPNGMFISSTVTNTQYMFYNTTYDKPVYIHTKYVANMFAGAYSFNSYVEFPDDIRSFENMFRGCNHFNREVVIRPSVTGAVSLNNMFNGCISFCNNIYIYLNSSASVYFGGFIQGAGVYKNRFIHATPGLFYNMRRITSGVSSITGAAITWDTVNTEYAYNYSYYLGLVNLH